MTEIEYEANCSRIEGQYWRTRYSTDDAYQQERERLVALQEEECRALYEFYLAARAPIEAKYAPALDAHLAAMKTSVARYESDFSDKRNRLDAEYQKTKPK